MIGLIIGLVLLGILIIVICMGIGIYNSLISLRTKAEEGFSTMDVYMKKRYDLIPNIVAKIKGYAKHEKDVFKEVVELRGKAINSSSDSEKIQNDGELTKAIGRLFAVAEAYPELKADKNFLDLQSTLKQIEAEIAESRKYYNAIVRDYNIKIQSFPSNVVAKMFKFSKKSLYELDNLEELKNVKVEF